MIEFQLEHVILVIFVLNMDRKSNMVQLFILGPSIAKNQKIKNLKTTNWQQKLNTKDIELTERVFWLWLLISFFFYFLFESLVSVF